MANNGMAKSPNDGGPAFYDDMHEGSPARVDWSRGNSEDPFPETYGETVRHTKQRHAIPEFPGLSRTVEALESEGDMDSRVRLLELGQSAPGANELNTSEESQERILRIASTFKMALDQAGGFSNWKAHEEADSSGVNKWDVMRVKMLKETIRALGY